MPPSVVKSRKRLPDSATSVGGSEVPVSDASCGAYSSVPS
jgi:hypothetical protein